MSLSTLEIYYAALRDLKRQREETESTMKKGDVIALKRLQKQGFLSSSLPRLGERRKR